MARFDPEEAFVYFTALLAMCFSAEQIHPSLSALRSLLHARPIVAIPKIRTDRAARFSPDVSAFLVVCALHEGFGTTFDSSGLRSI